MDLGALNSLAEVGIGINLAFGLVSQFRDKWQANLAGIVERVTSTARLALQEIREQGELPAPKWAKTCTHIFARTTAIGDPIFTVLAMGSALLLITFQFYVVEHSSDSCPTAYKWFVLALAVGPVFAWWLVLGVVYLFIRCSLYVMVVHDTRIVGVIKGLRTPIHPVDPEQGLPPSNRRVQHVKAATSERQPAPQSDRLSESAPSEPERNPLPTPRPPRIS